MKAIISILSGFMLVACSAIAGTELNQAANIDAALAQAKEENKVLLVKFTGSDWCPPCQALDRAVFSQDEFRLFANENLVVYIADFPRRKELPAEVAAHNVQLRDAHGVSSYPTVILFSPEGEELQRQVGFRRMTAAEYIENIKAQS